ncbi:MAG: hypothetical protein BWX84_01126 [Verrucomicrobia bacterium ADurb.Bin118]|nr:MAG: hypothetical protein BWX84_01126 [Verrucomicrobia bacterium ADurb.Bin118]
MQPRHQQQILKMLLIVQRSADGGGEFFRARDGPGRHERRKDTLQVRLEFGGILADIFRAAQQGFDVPRVGLLGDHADPRIRGRRCGITGFRVNGVSAAQHQPRTGPLPEKVSPRPAAAVVGGGAHRAHRVFQTVLGQAKRPGKPADDRGQKHQGFERRRSRADAPPHSPPTGPRHSLSHCHLHTLKNPRPRNRFHT